MSPDDSLTVRGSSPSIPENEFAAAVIMLSKLLGTDERTAERAILQIVHASEDKQSRERLIDVARRIGRHRVRRKGLFPQPIFGEPPWEMLLALYMEYPDASPSIRELASTVNLPTTSVARWLGYLEDHDLIRRMPNREDGRSIRVELTDSARRSLDDYLADVELG